MSIYSSFITPSQLISPVTGYACRRITKQNIKKFGFNDIEDLHKSYPDFPLMCEEYHIKVITSSRRGFAKAHRLNKQKTKKVIEDSKKHYDNNPNTCPKCNSLIPFELKNNKFCSRKCANSRKHTKETNLKRSLKLKKPEMCDISIVKCINCSNSFIKSKIKKNTKQKACNYCKSIAKTKVDTCQFCETNIRKKGGKYCIACSPNISLYRSRAAFKFNVYEFPKEFDLGLIEKYGWYSPNGYKKRNKTPNLQGVSRDHLYSVLDGFENNIDPKILSHPANCKIMIHNGPNGNNSKNRRSEITITELEERIKDWEKKYGESPQI